MRNVRLRWIKSRILKIVLNLTKKLRKSAPKTKFLQTWDFGVKKFGFGLCQRAGLARNECLFADHCFHTLRALAMFSLLMVERSSPSTKRDARAV